VYIAHLFLQTATFKAKHYSNLSTQFNTIRRKAHAPLSAVLTGIRKGQQASTRKHRTYDSVTELQTNIFFRPWLFLAYIYI